MAASQKPLATGSQLGPYQILGALGAGGMGEVYRARDTRLQRTVAVKIVNPRWSDGREGRARFEREAQIVSQLNHPNICALYDVGHAGDHEFLVMELVEGETLATRIARGPLSVDEVIRVGQALANGLDAAHRKGVVHRDFKPANAILSKHGPKVLDFGLARALADAAPADATHTVPFQTGATGAIVGTLPYMAPEQLQGLEVDARADVFALGAVLHEMATGRRAFDAPSQAGLIAAVLDHHPPAASSLRSGVPPLLDRLIARCLAKERDQRPQSAGEVGRILALIDDAEKTQPPAGVRATFGRERLLWIAVTIVLSGLAAVSLLRERAPASPPETVTSFEVSTPPGGDLPFVVDVATTLAISPDGRYLVFPLTVGETRQLWLHSFETLRTRPIRGTENALGPFWSPQSRHVAFFVPGALKRVSIDGDVVEQVCQTPTAVSLGSWGASDTILFSDSSVSALMRVSANGGTPEPVLSTAGLGTVWPHALPDGRRFLIGSTSGIHMGALGTPELTAVLNVPSAAWYSAFGHLLYVRDGVLVGQPFDLETGRVEGEPRVIAEGLQYFAPTGGASFSASATNAIAYRRTDIAPKRLVWLERDGREVADVAPDAPWVFKPRLSPDGSHLAVSQQILSSGSVDLWVHDLVRSTPLRLTADVQVDNWPAWWPDGRSVVFSRDVDGQAPHLVRRGLTDVETPKVLVPPVGQIQYDPDVAPDGGAIAYGQAGDIWLWRVGDTKAEPLVQTPFAEGAPAFSPDGAWLAYDSNVSGRNEVYVRPFPFDRRGEVVRVSAAGGSAPRWRRNGRELFFLDLQGRIMATAVSAGDVFASRMPQSIGESAGPIDAFDVTRDGQRFVAVLRKDRAPSTLTVILNWPALVR